MITLLDQILIDVFPRTLPLLLVGGGILALIAVLLHLSDNTALNGIKSQTVGDGQHGTARWATAKEIKQTYYDSIYASGLPHRAVTVYMYLKDRANRDGSCWPGVRTIAKELGISHATAKRALRDLEAGGWIVKTPRHRDNGSRTSNNYRIVQ